MKKQAQMFSLLGLLAVCSASARGTDIYVNAGHLPTPIPLALQSADARLHLVEDDVAFEGVGAGYVIVIGVPVAPDQTGGLVVGATEGLELHFHEAVFEPDI
jgi:hypothetical protein